MKTTICETIGFTLIAASIAAIPVGAWHTSTYNSPGIILGFFAAIVLATLASVALMIAE